MRDTRPLTLGLGLVLGALAGALPAQVQAGLRLDQIVQTLSSVPAGRDILERARKSWGLAQTSQVGNYLRWGQVSKTDAVLTRHFDPTTGKEERNRQVVVYLRRDMPLEETVLDLAHELVHAVEPPLWDPYDPDLTPARYVRVSIEGKGGEADAVVQECRVASNLMPLVNATVRARLSDRCKRYQTPATPVDRGLVVKDFYAVGAWKSKLLERLGAEKTALPLITGTEPLLYSSTGRTPYPVALVDEFDQMNEVACANSRRREAAGALRSLASGPPDETSRFLRRRCHDQGD
ncbi:MAG TPA: hypothetical protein VL588_00315 [Bdellovibrionota bacterium]|nr:hypothetical protein [Bdellovibrionota bacterium]